MTEQQILTDYTIQQLDKIRQKMANNTRVTLGNTVQMVFIKINTTRHKTSLCVQFSGKPIQQISVGGFVTSFQEAKTCKHFQGDKLEAVALA